jgi:hypothetical protein
MYTSRDDINAMESLGGVGSASMRITTMLSRAPTVMGCNASQRMTTFMQEVQENAVLLQGLKKQSNPEIAMRALVMRAMAELQLQEAGRCNRPSVARRPSVIFGQDQSLLMMNPVLDKVCSVKEERHVGCERPGARGGSQLLDRNMPTSSLGTHAIV